jgi:hypothetical protein
MAYVASGYVVAGYVLDVNRHTSNLKLNKTPRVTADISVHDALRKIAVTVNLMLDQIGTGSELGEYADDTAAAAGGVPLYGFYRTGNAVQQRLT